MVHMSCDKMHLHRRICPQQEGRECRMRWAHRQTHRSNAWSRGQPGPEVPRGARLSGHMAVQTGKPAFQTAQQVGRSLRQVASQDVPTPPAPAPGSAVGKPPSPSSPLGPQARGLGGGSGRQYLPSTASCSQMERASGAPAHPDPQSPVRPQWGRLVGAERGPGKGGAGSRGQVPWPALPNATKAAPGAASFMLTVSIRAPGASLRC